MKKSPASAKPTKKPSAKSRDVAVILPVDKALKAAWEKQAKLIAESSRQGMREWDRKYESVATIVEHNPPLYLAGGYEDFTSFANEHLHEDVRRVREWMSVAQRASPDEETLYTPTRLALLIAMLRAQSKDGTIPDRIDWKKVRVPVMGEGVKKGSTKSALQASLEEIRAARRVAMHSGETPADHERKEVLAVRAVLKGDALSAVKVQYRDGMYTFGAVPAYVREDFARALLAIDDKPSTPPAKPPAKKTKKSTR